MQGDFTMKLIMENWRKFCNNQKLNESASDFDGPFPDNFSPQFENNYLLKIFQFYLAQHNLTVLQVMNPGISEGPVGLANRPLATLPEVLDGPLNIGEMRVAWDRHYDDINVAPRLDQTTGEKVKTQNLQNANFQKILSQFHNAGMSAAGAQQIAYFDQSGPSHYNFLIDKDAQMDIVLIGEDRTRAGVQTVIYRFDGQSLSSTPNYNLALSIKRLTPRGSVPHPENPEKDNNRDVGYFKLEIPGLYHFDNMPNGIPIQA